MRSAFEIFLRTGKVRVPDGVEVKFNPWHDPTDGRFTFRQSGRFSGEGSSSSFARRPSRTDPRVVRLGEARRRATDTVDIDRFRPENPHNHTVHIVRKGELIGSIARTRKGLRPRDLAELNGLKDTGRRQIGQSIKLPHQSYLDDGKRARDKFMALAFYMDRHGGRLPPDASNPPSIASQIDSDIRVVARNGHSFKIDAINRTREVTLDLNSPANERRSRTTQRNAGKPHRLPTDDGGHYVAPRFGGPRDAFNHFAQDANFNRGAYRVLENKWDTLRKAKKSVPIRITPLYDGLSQRPHTIVVRYWVDGILHFERFPNRKGGK